MSTRRARASRSSAHREKEGIAELEGRGLYLVPPDLVSIGVLDWMKSGDIEVQELCINARVLRYAPLVAVALARGWKATHNILDTRDENIFSFALDRLKSDQRFADELTTVVMLARPDGTPRDLWEREHIERVRTYLVARFA